AAPGGGDVPASRRAGLQERRRPAGSRHDLREERADRERRQAPAPCPRSRARQRRRPAAPGHEPAAAAGPRAGGGEAPHRSDGRDRALLGDAARLPGARPAVLRRGQDGGGGEGVAAGPEALPERPAAARPARRGARPARRAGRGHGAGGEGPDPADGGGGLGALPVQHRASGRLRRGEDLPGRELALPAAGAGAGVGRAAAGRRNGSGKMSPKSLKRSLFPALAGLLLAAAVQAQVAVRILSPEAGQPVFGSTDVRVGVQAGVPIDRVEVFVNGKLAGTCKQPPYHVQVDVGEENVKREFKAVAYTPTGGSGADSVLTQPVTINDQMDLKLRALFVSVTRDGLRALNLGKDDFEVRDNGVPQEVVTFGRDELPLTAVLLLDTSESMSKRQEAVRRGAKAFLDGMKSSDEAMMALFSDRLLRFTPFTSDKKALETAIASTQAAGGTAVNDFLYMSLKLLDARQGQRVVVLFSDGSDVHSVLPA